MKTLEQVIADCKEEISDCQIDLDGISELLEKYPERKEAFAYDINNYKKRMDYNRQLAAWLRELRELQERRKAPKIVFCKDCQKHNVKVGFDENFHTVWKEDACPLVDWRGKAKEHEFDYQYCAFAERRTDEMQ